MPKKAREQDAKNKSIENPPTRNFFTPRVTAAASQSQSVPASQSESESAVPTEGIDDISKQTSPTDEDFVVDNDEEDVIDANLDIDEDETRADNHCDEGDLLNECDLGVQQEYVKAVQLRLGDEVREDNKSTDLYLLEHLKDNDWRIRKEHAPKFSRKLGLSETNSAYYRDVYVWLPDIRWPGCMPCCPTCLSNDQVGNNGFHTNHFGQLIVGLKENYYGNQMLRLQ